MKRFLSVIAIVALTVGLTACGGKKKSDDIIAPRVVTSKPSEPVKMQEYTDEKNVKWVEGRSYHVEVQRQPCDSLPKVKDENGQQFVDNIFTLTVSRADGSVFFHRTFTKRFFTSYINADYQKTGILEGIVFDRVDGDWLVFAASVAHPQTDEYIPLVMRLSRMGNLEVTQDSQMDTGNPSTEVPDNLDDEDGV